MQTKRMTFPGRFLPYALLAPQVIVTLIFFICRPDKRSISRYFVKMLLGYARPSWDWRIFPACFVTATISTRSR